jgi:hypothetical protein
MTQTIAVYLETAPKRTFAVAVDWPGWARSGKTEADALAALAASAPRYAKVAKRAGEPFGPPGDVDLLRVVERINGGSGTEFGVPSATPAADRKRISDRDLDRLTRLLKAAWATFDAAAKAAEGKTLRLGPRGGGRDLRKMRTHVLEAELAYVRQLGSGHKPAARASESDAMAAARKAEIEALAARARGAMPANPSAVRKPWEPRYFVRRSAWHVLDHAWEIEDRKE